RLEPRGAWRLRRRNRHPRAHPRVWSRPRHRLEVEADRNDRGARQPPGEELDAPPEPQRATEGGVDPSLRKEEDERVGPKLGSPLDFLQRVGEGAAHPGIEADRADP